MVAILNFGNIFKNSIAHFPRCYESDLIFWTFWTLVLAATQKLWSWPLAAILNFGSIFKKSLAHSHIARNVILKFERNDY